VLKLGSNRGPCATRNLGAAEQLAHAALGLAGRMPAFGAINRDETVIALLEETPSAVKGKEAA